MSNVQWGVIKFKADAQKCFDEVQALGKEYTANQVLELARDSKTELHKCFDWDDTSAAEKWRLEQARLVIRSFTVIVEKEDNEPQSYRVIQHDREEKVYRPITYTVRNEDQYARLLKQAKQELATFRSKYKSIIELEKVIDEIDAVLTA